MIQYYLKQSADLINEPHHEKINNVFWSNSNRAVQAQKMARSWKFWIKKVDELYHQCSKKTKPRISSAVTSKMICAFDFAYVKCWFYQDTAHHKHDTNNSLSLELRHEKSRLLHMQKQSRRSAVQCNCTADLTLHS